MHGVNLSPGIRQLMVSLHLFPMEETLEWSPPGLSSEMGTVFGKITRGDIILTTAGNSALLSRIFFLTNHFAHARAWSVVTRRRA